MCVSSFSRLRVTSCLALRWALLATAMGVLLSCNNPTTNTDGDKFADHIRTTPHQTPEQQLAGFTLPTGFEISLFAAEPDIGKPINMEFDDRGRLWVTQSSEYPNAAPDGEGHDRITILEDRDGDGRADSFTHIDESLNIPIGIMPIDQGAVGFSIPYLYRFDVTSEGKSVQAKEALIGPFEYKDTHGMVNNLIRGYDGWIHACHGFTNISTVAGTDGDSITLTSGSTFRFKLDGSRVEKTSDGRINPFGMAYDERGYLYSVDCHSRPIYQLIIGADYPQWGRKEPAIGYAPEMMGYGLGSTAISGLVYYASTQFPAAYQNSFFTGDVVTSRIDRNTVTYQGSTPVAQPEEPFLTSDDPWFRPVDIKIGPDGSLYVADFYNRIIGHYEVDLDHPDRDRHSGRIWKITYTGDDRGNVPVRDWSTATVDELISALSHPQLVTRLKIADRLVDAHGSASIALLQDKLRHNELSPTATVHGLWILHRLGALSESMLNNALQHTDANVRLHALRTLRESATLSPTQAKLTREALLSTDPHLQRIAAEVLGRFHGDENVDLLLDTYLNTPDEDTHLKYTALLALRSNMHDPGVVTYTVNKKWADHQLPILVNTMRDVPGPAVARFVLDYVLNHDVPHATLVESLQHLGRYAEPTAIARSVPTIESRFANDLPTQLAIFTSIREGIAQGGTSVPAALSRWGSSLAHHFLATASNEQEQWMSRPMQDRHIDQSPWIVADHFLTDIVPPFRIYFSERNGYPPMATLYTSPFALPGQIRMNVFDNDIHHTEEKIGLSNNAVRIRLAESNKVIAEYRAKQDEVMTYQDLIKEVSLDLSAYAGQQGYIEVVDSSSIGSIGIGKLEPAVVDMPFYTPSDLDDWRAQAATIAGEFRIKDLRRPLLTLLTAHGAGSETRKAAAKALANMPEAGDLAVFGTILLDSDAPLGLREQVASNLGQAGSAEAIAFLCEATERGSRAIQLASAIALASTAQGLNGLLSTIDAGGAPVDLLAEPKVNEAWYLHIRPAQQSRIDAFLANGEDDRKLRQSLIQQRVEGFDNTGRRIAKGKAVFETNCSACHQVNGSGGLIGPQLDGIGNWGVQALTEKILDPNRNISESFRTYTIKLKDGEQRTGLMRRREGEVIVFADINGREFSVEQSQIDTLIASRYTLMPDQYRHILSEEQFGELMEYLLDNK